MAFSLNKINPFSSEFDFGRASLALLTGGTSVGIEAGAELAGEAAGEIDRAAKFSENIETTLPAMFRPEGLAPDLSGTASAQQEATRQLYDPRFRKRSGGGMSSATLTGQYDSQPSLIG